jgi:tetratricopeptide (TPR) repeat protein
MAYMAKEDFARAEQEFTRQIEVNEKSGVVYMQLAGARARQDNQDGAEAALLQGLDVLPGDARLTAALANFYSQQGDLDKAAAVYTKALDASPDERTDEVSLNQAKELASKLAAAKQPALLDTLGWVHYRVGEYDKAAEILSGVVEQAPDVPVFRYHLGMTYYKQGDNRAAKEILSKAVAKDMKYDGVEEARRVYKEIGG